MSRGVVLPILIVFVLFLLYGLRLSRREVLAGLSNHRLLVPLAGFVFGVMTLAGWALWQLSDGLLPPVLAAPLGLLPLVGWAGWRSGAGLFGTLYYGGYAVFLMLAGRENNFYWALMITPAYFIGLAFVPGAFAALWRSARGRTAA